MVAGILVERGADIDAHGTMLGDTALHNAVLYNEPAVVEFLLETGAGTGITIIRPGHVWHGLTAAGLASWLNDNADRRKSDWSEIETILVNQTDLGGDRAEP